MTELAQSVHYDSLRGRVVLVTGGASGIGRAIVTAFAAQGARVGFLDLDTAAAQTTIAACGGNAPEFWRCDLTDIAALRGAIANARASLGPIAVLVNNAGNRQKTLAALNDLWQGNPIRRTRSGDGHITLFGRRLAVHLMAQPGVARAFMADPLAADSGFLPRFLMCEPPSAIGTRLQSLTRRDDVALAGFAGRLRDILESPMTMDPETRELHPRYVPLSNPARELLVQFADAIEAAQAPGGDLAHITGTASKAAEQAARIAGVLTLWRDLFATEVQPRDMADAIALAQFYLGEASRLASAAIVSAEIDRAEALRKWLIESWPEPDVLVRDVVRLGPNPLRESPKARAALGILEKHGWLVALEPGTVARGAARKESWRIVKGAGDV